MTERRRSAFKKKRRKKATCPRCGAGRAANTPCVCERQAPAKPRKKAKRELSPEVVPTAPSAPKLKKRARVPKAKTVQGFGVKGQHRTRLRDDLDGHLEDGTGWVIYGEGEGLFQWRLGKWISGYAGPTLGHALRAIRKAHKAITAIKERYGGSVNDTEVRMLYRLIRWERRLHQGRLVMEGPDKQGRYTIWEKGVE